MSRKRERAIWGYHPASFETVIQDIQTVHQEKMAELNARAEALEQENENLRQEIAQIEEELAHPPDVMQEVSQMLLTAHLQQTQAVYELQAEVKQMELKQQEIYEMAFIQRERVVQRALDQLRQLEAGIRLGGKERDRGGSSDL